MFRKFRAVRNVREGWIVPLLIGLLLACGDSNPIIGVWVVDSDATSTGAAAAAALAGVRKGRIPRTQAS